ncbi:hypothetical protein ACQ5SP_11725 [Rhodovulum sp. YNF3179]|uniref:hypothetical protein n=1 Tax=Rhodovulum sp. YNF3179 TaxID=3425127 RepID=UPI003D33D8A1
MFWHLWRQCDEIIFKNPAKLWIEIVNRYLEFSMQPKLLNFHFLCLVFVKKYDQGFSCLSSWKCSEQALSNAPADRWRSQHPVLSGLPANLE